MPYGLDLSKYTDGELDIAGYSKNVIPRKSYSLGTWGTGHTTYNPYVPLGTIEDVGSGALVPLAEPLNKDIIYPRRSSRGVDFDFTPLDTTARRPIPSSIASTVIPISDLSLDPSISGLKPKRGTIPPSYQNTKEFVSGVAAPPSKTKRGFTDWWKNLPADRKEALNTGLLSTGLNMMALGGRSYDRPVSALGVLGEAGTRGLATYEDTYNRERVYNLQKENADMAKKLNEIDITRFKASEPFLSESAKREHEIRGLQLEQLKKPNKVVAGSQYGFVRINEDGTVTELQKPVDKETMSKEYGYNRDEITNIVKLFRPEQTDIIDALLSTKDPAQMSNILETKKPIIEDIEKQLSRPEYATYKARWIAARENIDRIMGFKQPSGLNIAPEPIKQPAKEWQLYE